MHKGGNWLRGSEYSLTSIISGLKKTSFECSLWANNKELLALIDKLGIETTHEEFPHFMLDPGDRSLNIFSVINLIFRIYKAIRKEGYELIYCNGAAPAQAAYFAARLANIPIICHIRAPYPYRYIKLYNINRCNASIFVSNTTRDYHTKKSTFKNAITIYNGINPKRSINSPDLNISIDFPPKFNSIRLCQISAVVKYKGMDTIIGAMKILKQQGIYPMFYIAGKGEELDYYTNLIQQEGLNDQIILLGELSNISQLLSEHVDVNVLAAAWEEPFGRVIVEGYFENKPAIGSIAGGIPEIIEHGETGLLFKRESAKELAKCIQFFHENPSSINLMGEKAKNFAIEKFTEDTLIKKITAVIENIEY